jgi:hypothetical protein
MRQCEKCGRAGQATDDNIVWRMRIACRITKAANTPSEYVILIAFPRQQWLHELASMFVIRTYPLLFVIILQGRLGGGHFNEVKCLRCLLLMILIYSPES